MAEQRTAATPLLGGTLDRRELLAGVAALSAGALAAANEAHAQAQASARPRFIDFHHHFQSPEWVKYAQANGVRVPQFEREPVSKMHNAESPV